MGEEQGSGIILIERALASIPHARQHYQRLLLSQIFPRPVGSTLSYILFSISSHYKLVSVPLKIFFYQNTSAPLAIHTSTPWVKRWMIRPDSLLCLTKYTPELSLSLQLFDRQMIQLWLSKQGSICPLSGQPLVEAELTPDEKVQEEVKAWQKELLQKKTSSLGKNSTGKSKAKPTVGGREGGKHQQELTGSSSNSPSLRTRPIDEAAKLSLEGRSDTEAISGVEDDKGCPESVRRDSGGNGRECKGTVDEDDLYDF